jgi:hypothetical protein
MKRQIGAVVPRSGRRIRFVSENRSRCGERLHPEKLNASCPPAASQDFRDILFLIYQI